ncbi:MAG: ATP cone domain-containing protein, partial [Candidatus Omnitrophica bacterium]|nr:ATP cone domain-containing protein [Candidatus Omnitrophota bacterium]
MEISIKEGFKEIVKRDGEKASFNARKITDAIAKAGKVTGEFQEDTAKMLTIKSGASMITVTRTEVSRDMKHGTIFISVLPESKEDAAINFAKR